MSSIRSIQNASERIRQFSNNVSKIYNDCKSSKLKTNINKSKSNIQLL